MIVKGHDFPKVTLVGVLAADLSLHAGDYRGAEKTFQLLAQAAGRAGRGERPGQVVFQTYQPEHYSITSAAGEDYVGFYHQELKMRQMLQYPPISHILEVLVSSEKQERAEALAEAFSGEIRDMQGVVMLGPADAGIAKLKNSYRKVIYIKSVDGQVLRGIAARGEAFLHGGEGWKDCTMTFSFD
jgi:Primosomal protein N'' (replication factor Y) - superfamily II helicase